MHLRRSLHASWRCLESFSWLEVTSRCTSRRSLQIKSIPSQPSNDGDPLASLDLAGVSGSDSPDARFEVLGTPSSLLSVTLSASQNLYTRRGTFVGMSGRADNAISTLSLLSPLKRAALRIPFFYQKISSASPLTLLLSTRTPNGSFTVLNLDGTVDWMVAQRKALLAWTGQSLSIRPVVNTNMVRHARWGNSQVGGRGLLALVSRGHAYQVTIGPEEEFIVHPSNLVAYTITRQSPSPYRLKSTSLRLQIPQLGLFPESKFLTTMRESDTWRLIARAYFAIRTWSRRTIWGDRLFLRFQGPTILLLQGHGSSLREVLSNRDVNEIAQAEPAAVQSALRAARKAATDEGSFTPKSKRTRVDTPVHLRVASVRSNNKVEFEDTSDFQSLTTAHPSSPPSR